MSKQQIRRGIDCRCDYEYICRFHLNKIKWRGAIMGIGISALIYGSMWYSEEAFEIVTTGLMGVMGLLTVGVSIYWFIKL